MSFNETIKELQFESNYKIFIRSDMIIESPHYVTINFKYFFTILELSTKLYKCHNYRKDKESSSI